MADEYLLLETGSPDNLLLETADNLLLESSTGGGTVTGTADLSTDAATLAGTGLYAELDSFSASAALTTDAATTAATGAVGVNATSSLTTDAATLAATGAMAPPGVSADVALATEVATVAATGAVGVNATSSLTTDAATLAATGTAAAPSEVTGTATLTTDAAAVAATGTVTNAYTAAVTLAAEVVTLSATGVYAAAAPDFVDGVRLGWELADPGVRWQAEDPGLTWKASGGDAVVFATLEHLAGWSRVYNCSFEDFAEIRAGQSISSVTDWTWPAGITAGTPSVSGGVVQVRLSGATEAAELTATCTVATSGGDTLSQKTPLRVEV